MAPSPVSLRVRLTLWYSSILAILIALFGLSAFGAVTLIFNWQIEQRLTQTAQSILRASATATVWDVDVLYVPTLKQFSTSNVFIQIWQVDGWLYSSSSNLEAINYTQALDAATLKATQPTWSESITEDGVHLKVYTHPMRNQQGDILGILQVAAPLNALDVVRSGLVLVLGVGGVVAVLLAGAVGFVIAGRALRPLESITQTALQISRADDLARRIPLPPGATQSQDEVGRLTQTFNELLERLEQLFNAQRRFLADISHELRTPLTAIRGNVDLLRRMGGADTMSLDAIQSEAERMSRLVGDLLVLAQAEAGRMPMARERVELDTLLLEVFREAQVLTHGVVVTIGEIDQLQVMGDRDRLKQLWLNLVSNALKFTPEGGRVTLGLAQVEQMARLTVADTGCGIPPNELKQVFDRFYRVDRTRARALGGAGLGLSIALRIVQMHQGRIEAASDGVPGHGSIFTVWLPLTASSKTVAENALTRPNPRLAVQGAVTLKHPPAKSAE